MVVWGINWIIQSSFIRFTSLKLISHLKIGRNPKEKSVFQPSIFRCNSLVSVRVITLTPLLSIVLESRYVDQKSERVNL